MDRRDAARLMLHVTPLYQHWHDHEQFDLAARGRFWRQLPDGTPVRIERYEEARLAYEEAHAVRARAEAAAHQAAPSASSRARRP